jgi:hypothetical protein
MKMNSPEFFLSYEDAYWHPEEIYEEAGFLVARPRTCECDSVPYKHTHELGVIIFCGVEAEHTILEES